MAAATSLPVSSNSPADGELVECRLSFVPFVRSFIVCLRVHNKSPVIICSFLGTGIIHTNMLYGGFGNIDDDRHPYVAVLFASDIMEYANVGRTAATTHKDRRVHSTVYADSVAAAAAHYNKI